MNVQEARINVMSNFEYHMERHISGHVARPEKESREIDEVFIQKMMYILNAADEHYEILKQLFVQIFKDHVFQVQNRHHVMSLVRHVLSVNKNLQTRCVDFKLFVASLWTQMEEQEQKDLVGIEQEMSKEMEAAKQELEHAKTGKEIKDAKTRLHEIGVLFPLFLQFVKDEKAL